MMLDLFQGRRTLARADLPRSMPEARAAKRPGPWEWTRLEITGELEMGGAVSVESGQAFALHWDPHVSDYTDLPRQRLAVYDIQRLFSKMATAEGDSGAFGMACRAPDRGVWELTSMQTPGAFWGAFVDNMNQGHSGATVEMVTMIDGYDVFGGNWNAAHGGPRITAINPAAGGRAVSWFAAEVGDGCLCVWNMKNGNYEIRAVEPNPYWYGTQTVVTGVNFGAQEISTKVFKSPPWALPT